MEQSAAVLATFVNKVLAATGATKVDIVGHSEGATMPDYYVKFLGGARKVDHYVGISSVLKGTTYSNTVGRNGPATIWAQADQAVMKDAAIYPITDPLQPNYHASYVHNAVYVPAIQQFDPTNVWLSTP